MHRYSYAALPLLAFISAMHTYPAHAPAPAIKPGAPIPTGLNKDIYDVRPLLHPARKFFGVFRSGAPKVMKPVDEYAALVGKRPNVIVSYAQWGDEFDSAGVSNAWKSGALTAISWEPKVTPVTSIADGAYDQYIRSYAAAARRLNIPVVISFADEMNGDWESWGTTGTTPQEYVRSWRHIHDVFEQSEAENVIWAWSPNMIKPGTRADLEKFYPGDRYCDWVGIVGYFTDWDPHTFDGLFGDTLAELRRFTQKPNFILETGAMPGRHRASDIAALFSGVSTNPGIIGFAWFDSNSRQDWRLSVNPEGVVAFRRYAQNPLYGFDPREIK
ncbi:glycoside hydrolase family 26 protein [Streptomyces sp. NPDC048362]|uniref:glycoside hydrolase family 26 protein n=1 Tax=Streptomyces sp. NPDC048362 TaxID=3365539 RepID=UPI00371639CB